MTTGLIRRTLKKFGAQPYLLTIASELEKEAKEMEDIYSGGGNRAEVWAEEIRSAIKRANGRLAKHKEGK